MSVSSKTGKLIKDYGRIQKCRFLRIFTYMDDVLGWVMKGLNSAPRGYKVGPAETRIGENLMRKYDKTEKPTDQVNYLLEGFFTKNSY